MDEWLGDSIPVLLIQVDSVVQTVRIHSVLIQVIGHSIQDSSGSWVAIDGRLIRFGGEESDGQFSQTVGRFSPFWS